MLQSMSADVHIESLSARVGLDSAGPGSRVWQRTGVVARVCSDVAQVCPGLGWAALRRKAPPAETPPPAIPITSGNAVVKTCCEYWETRFTFVQVKAQTEFLEFYQEYPLPALLSIVHTLFSDN